MAELLYRAKTVKDNNLQYFKNEYAPFGLNLPKKLIGLISPTYPATYVSEEWIIPLVVEETNVASSFVTVLNTGSSSNTVTVTFYNGKGTEYCKEKYSLASGESYDFQTLNIPSCTNLEMGWARAKSDSGTSSLLVSSFGIINLTNKFVLPSVHATDASNKWIVPLVVDSVQTGASNISSTVTVLNTGASSNTVTAKFYDENGKLICKEQYPLTAGENHSFDSSNISGCSNFNSGSATVESDSGTSSLLASAYINVDNSKFVFNTPVYLPGQVSSDWSVPVVIQMEKVGFTQISVHNTETASNTFTMKFYNSEGTVYCSTQYPLAAGETYTTNTNSLSGCIDLDIGSARIESDSGTDSLLVAAFFVDSNYENHFWLPSYSKSAKKWITPYFADYKG